MRQKKIHMTLPGLFTTDFRTPLNFHIMTENEYFRIHEDVDDLRYCESGYVCRQMTLSYVILLRRIRNMIYMKVDTDIFVVTRDE